MMTHGSLVKRSASSLAEINTSVMAASPSWWFQQGRTRILSSRLGQHLAKLLGGGRDDGDEIGLAQAALGAMALEVAARAAMKHRGMRGRDRRVARAQAKRDHAAPIGLIRIERIARQHHGLALELGKQLLELHRLLRQIAVDMAERQPTSSMMLMQ